MTNLDEILKERGATHGPFALQAEFAQHLKRVFRQNEVNRTPAQNFSLDMIANKLSRILVGHANVEDHWLDIAGYAKLIVDELQKPPEPGAKEEGVT